MREERVASLLEGKAIEVSVGEPWDFESSAGAGRLVGEILSAKVTPEAQSVVLKVNPFRAETGQEASVLEARARYQEDIGDLVRKLAHGERVPATLDYSAQVSRESMPEGVEAFLVGSVSLTD